MFAIVRVLVATLAVFEEGYPMRNFGRDIVYALRRLRTSPAFTIFSVVTLAFGIGATTAVVSLVESVTGPPSGVSQPATLVSVWHTPWRNNIERRISWADFSDYKAKQKSFSLVTAWTPVLVSILVNGRSESGFGEIVDGDYFSALGVRPAIGRVLGAGDNLPNAPAVAVINDGIWRRDFDAVPDVVGRTVKVNGVLVPVVGVAPASFQGLFNGGLVPTGVWLSASAAPLMQGEDFRLDRDRDNRWLQVFGRLAPAATLSRAQAEASVIARQLDASYPLGLGLDASARRRPEEVSRRWTLHLLTDSTRIGNADDVMPLFISTVFFAVTLVLLVACTNLANLTVARGAARRHDVAVRLAMGGTRARLIRGELTESLILVVLGALAGLALAAVLLNRVASDIAFGRAVVRLVPVLNGDAFAGAVAASLLALLVAGVVPAWLSTRTDVRAALGSGGQGGAVPRWRGRRWLVGMQVAVSMLFLCLTMALASQARREIQHDSGIAMDRLALANVDFLGQQVDNARTRELAEQIVSVLAHEPGVVMAAATTGLPFGATNPGCAVARLISELKTSHATPCALIGTTLRGIPTVGARVLSGRDFNTRDTASSQSVALVSASLAQELFDTTNVVGREVQVQPRGWVGIPAPAAVARTIVGVVSDTDGGNGKAKAWTVYVPLSQQPWGRLTFEARTEGDPAAVVPALRRAIAAVAPDIATEAIGPAVSVTQASSGPLQAMAAVTGLLGSFALGLALIGLYGVLSYVVARRRREMGVRVALGAEGRQILRMVIGDGLKPVVAGIVAGLALAVLASFALQSIFLHMIPTADPIAVAVAPTLILVAGWVACYLPARRASRVDPNIALRDL